MCDVWRDDSSRKFINQASPSPSPTFHDDGRSDNEDTTPKDANFDDGDGYGDGDGDILPQPPVPSMVELIKDDNFFITYGKKSFFVSADNVVLRGKPFEFDNGMEMGRVLNSKSPEEWKRVKTKHVTVLSDGAHDFLYITAYVAGSEAESTDIKRLHPISKVVSKALIARFNNSNISDERKKSIFRLLHFTPPPDDIGPQITPAVAGWKLIGTDISKIPTSAIKPVAKSRVSTQKKLSRRERRVIEAVCDGMQGKRALRAESDSSLPSIALTARAEDTDVGTHMSDVKRMRTLDVLDAARTHVFIGTNNKVFCIEY